MIAVITIRLKARTATITLIENETGRLLMKVSDRDEGRGQGTNPGGGRGRIAGSGMGAGGFCICARCGHRVPHRQGVKCTDERCPSCGVALLREGSPHHQKIEARRSDTVSDSQDSES